MTDDVWTAPDAKVGVADHGPLAEIGDRFLAALIDLVAGWVPLAPAVLTALAFQENGELPDDPPPLFVAMALLGMGGVFGVAVWQWVGIVASGQTVGKRQMGIRIVGLDGSPVDFVRGVVLRNWVLAFAVGVLNQCCLGWILGLADVLMIFGPDRRCLHDHIAGTKVVAARAGPRDPDGPFRIA